MITLQILALFFYIRKFFSYFNITLTYSAAAAGRRASSVVELTIARRQPGETGLSETKSPQGFIFVAERAFLDTLLLPIVRDHRRVFFAFLVVVLVVFVYM